MTRPRFAVASVLAATLAACQEIPSPSAVGSSVPLTSASAPIQSTASDLLYLLNHGEISIIETGTRAVVGSITGLGPCNIDLAAAPDGATVYSLDSCAPELDVFETSTNTATGSIPLSALSPNGFAITPDGSHAWVAGIERGSGPFTGIIDIIDLQSGTMVGQIPLPPSTLVPTRPEGEDVAFSPDGSLAYVITPSSVRVFNTATRSLITELPTGQTSRDVQVSPDGTLVYVSNFNSHDVTVVSTATHSVAATIAVQSPVDIAFAPDGARAYVSNDLANRVTVIRTSDSRVLAFPPVGRQARPVAVTSDGSELYVGNSADGSVSVLSTSSNTVMATIPVPFGSIAMAMIPRVAPPGPGGIAVQILGTANGLATFQATWTGNAPFAWDARPLDPANSPNRFADPHSGTSAQFNLVQQAAEYTARFEVWEKGSSGGYTSLGTVQFQVPATSAPGPVAVRLLSASGGIATFEATWSGTAPFAWDARPLDPANGPKSFSDPYAALSVQFDMAQQGFLYNARFQVWEKPATGRYIDLGTAAFVVPAR